MNILIVGASAGLGRALAEEAARLGHPLLLVASDARDLTALAADLRLQHGAQAEFAACRLNSEPEWMARVIEAAGRLGPLDALWFPIGASLDDDCGTLDADAARQLLEVNFFSIARVVSHFWPEFIARGCGQIVGFGSIAAVRGRGANVMYSAAKRALLSYFESLRHMAARTGICVQFYQLGYLDTQQAFGRKLLFPKCPPERVAAMVTRNLGKDVGIVFHPAFWRVIAILLRWLPWPLFKRLRF